MGAVGVRYGRCCRNRRLCKQSRGSDQTIPFGLHAEGAVPSCVLLDLRYDLALRSDSILWKVLYENSILPYGENHYGSYLGHHTSLCNQTKIKGDKWEEM